MMVIDIENNMEGTVSVFPPLVCWFEENHFLTTDSSLVLSLMYGAIPPLHIRFKGSSAHLRSTNCSFAILNAGNSKGKLAVAG